MAQEITFTKQADGTWQGSFTSTGTRTIVQVERQENAPLYLNISADNGDHNVIYQPPKNFKNQILSIDIAEGALVTIVSHSAVTKAQYIASELDYYTKAETDEKIAQIYSLEPVVVDTLPTASEDTMKKLYFVPKTGGGETGNIKEEYITVRTVASGSGTEADPYVYSYSWEQVGDTSTQIQADWNQTNTSAADYIKNKPTPDVVYCTFTPTNGDNGTVDITAEEVYNAVQANKTVFCKFNKLSQYVTKQADLFFGLFSVSLKNGTYQATFRCIDIVTDAGFYDNAYIIVTGSSATIYYSYPIATINGSFGQSSQQIPTNTSTLPIYLEGNRIYRHPVASGATSTTLTLYFRKEGIAYRGIFDNTSNTSDLSISFDVQIGEFAATAVSQTITDPELSATGGMTIPAGSIMCVEVIAMSSTAYVRKIYGENSVQGGLHNVQADWSESDNTKDDYIKNKPTNVSTFTNDAGYLTEADKDFYLITITETGAADPYAYECDRTAQEIVENVIEGEKVPIYVLRTGADELPVVLSQGATDDYIAGNPATAWYYHIELYRFDVTDTQYATKFDFEFDYEPGGNPEVDMSIRNRGAVGVQANWNQSDNTKLDFVKNKPTLGTASALDVAASGDASATQVVKGDDSRLSDARNAADVYSWAKESNKPTYNYSEIQNTPTLPTSAQLLPAVTSTDNGKILIVDNGAWAASAVPVSDSVLH